MAGDLIAHDRAGHRCRKCREPLHFAGRNEIVEALDVVEHVSLRLVSLLLYILTAVRSVFNDEKKLSIAALSQTLPERLIERMTP
jgi:hypothetical protein